MKFQTTFNLLGLTALATAASREFGIVTIHSGSMFQYASLYANKGQNPIYVGLGDETGTFLLRDDGSVTFQGQKLGLNNDNVVGLASGDFRQLNEFSIEDDHLLYNGKNSFIACPGSDKKSYVLSTGSCNSGTGIVLRVVDLSSSSSSSSAKPTTTSKPSTTAKPTTAKTVTTTKATSTKASTTTAAAVDDKSFGAIAIHSGSDVQNAAIKKVDSHTQVFSVGGDAGKDIVFTLQSDGSLKDQDGRGIYIQSSGEFGNVDPFGKQEASKTFTLKDGDLAYNGNTGFYACPSGNGNSLSTILCYGGTSIALKAVSTH